MYEKRLVLSFNGLETIYVGFGHGKDMEVIFSIDGVKSGVSVSRKVFVRNPEDRYLLPLTTKKESELVVDPGFDDNYNSSYCNKVINFQESISADYKLITESFIDIDYWSPCHIVIDKFHGLIKIFILSVNGDENFKSHYIEKFIIEGLSIDKWTDVDINGACETIGNRIRIEDDGCIDILVHNKQNVNLFD